MNAVDAIAQIQARWCKNLSTISFANTKSTHLILFQNNFCAHDHIVNIRWCGWIPKSLFPAVKRPNPKPRPLFGSLPQFVIPLMYVYFIFINICGKKSCVTLSFLMQTCDEWQEVFCQKICLIISVDGVSVKTFNLSWF